MRRIDLVSFLVIAEQFCGIDAHQLARMPRVVALAESALAAPFAGFDDIDVYPSLEERAAIYCSRIAKNHTLPDGNKRAAYATMRMFLSLNDVEWTSAPGDQDAEAVEQIAAGTITEADLVRWVRERTTRA